ncbi:hypothetical protein ACIRPK_14095 [Kitasatospora sp. NPDC101801]|uniref:hypothetical protein n=1 Tax=Kitasatospora sp. NPDC101801 TaxID=3364103 RepID=UPI00381A5251
MAGEQFGVELQELGRIQQDWQQTSQRMAELQQRLGKIQDTLAKAVAVDLAASPLAGIAGFGIAFDVLRDAKDVESRARHLMQTKEKLTKAIAEDTEKIKSVIKAYTEADRKVQEDLKEKEKSRPKGDDGSTRINGTDKGSGNGNGGNGNGGSGNGGGDTKHQGDGNHGKYGDHSTGDRGVKYINGDSWEDWNGNTKTHPRNGEGKGALVRPNMEGLDAERKEILERAMKRVDMKLGYSQGAITDGYRVDCSGFVSAAWGIPPGSYGGLNTDALMTSKYSYEISKKDLQPGDALINGDHTILFGGWANAEHTKYIAIENAGQAGTVSRVSTMDNRYGFYRRKDL